MFQHAKCFIKKKCGVEKSQLLKKKGFQLLQGSFYQDYHLQQIKCKIIVVTFLHLPNPSVYVN